jgi:putative ribosome biogenesis GTPase RsgA
MATTKLPPLVLPIRYERLQEKAQELKQDLSRIVVRVESALKHTQELLFHMTQTQMSRFEVMYGASGAGKTTFLETVGVFLV